MLQSLNVCSTKEMKLSVLLDVNMLLSLSTVSFHSIIAAPLLGFSRSAQRTDKPSCGVSPSKSWNPCISFFAARLRCSGYEPCFATSAHTRFVHVQGSDHTVEIIAAILLPVAILMCVYSLTVFIWRAKAIARKQVSQR